MLSCRPEKEEAGAWTFFSPEHLIALLTMTLLEIVLGIDNVIFISIPADTLPKNQLARARCLGPGLAIRCWL